MRSETPGVSITADTMMAYVIPLLYASETQPRTVTKFLKLLSTTNPDLSMTFSSITEIFKTLPDKKTLILSAQEKLRALEAEQRIFLNYQIWLEDPSTPWYETKKYSPKKHNHLLECAHEVIRLSNSVEQEPQLLPEEKYALLVENNSQMQELNRRMNIWHSKSDRNGTSALPLLMKSIPSFTVSLTQGVTELEEFLFYHPEINDFFSNSDIISIYQKVMHQFVTYTASKNFSIKNHPLPTYFYAFKENDPSFKVSDEYTPHALALIRAKELNMPHVWNQICKIQNEITNVSSNRERHVLFPVAQHKESSTVLTELNNNTPKLN